MTQYHPTHSHTPSPTLRTNQRSLFHAITSRCDTRCTIHSIEVLFTNSFVNSTHLPTHIATHCFAYYHNLCHFYSFNHHWRARNAPMMLPLSLTHSSREAIITLSSNCIDRYAVIKVFYTDRCDVRYSSITLLFTPFFTQSR